MLRVIGRKIFPSTLGETNVTKGEKRATKAQFHLVKSEVVSSF